MNFSNSVQKEFYKEPIIADVLYVEDSQLDILMTNDVLEKNQILFNLHTVEDGDRALDVLKGETIIADKIDMILLDFNLPKINGLQILKFIKEQDQLKDIPVIMLTGSDKPADIEQACSLGAVDYMFKPFSADILENTVERLSSLEWVRIGNKKYLSVVN